MYEMKKIIITLITLIIALTGSFAQIHTSDKYGYQIEIPSDYESQKTVGKNVDLTIADKLGNSIVIVIKRLQPEAKNSSAYVMFNITKNQWEQSLAEYLPNPDFIKSGKSKLNNKEAFWIHYTSYQYSEPKLYHITYMVFYKGLQYVITASCDEIDLDSNMPVFIRSIQSFKF